MYMYTDTVDFMLILLSQAASSWLHIVPWGIRKLVKHVKDKYGDTPVIITENGEFYGWETVEVI